MKISKNLLQAILIGATLGTAVSSCGATRESKKKDHVHTEECSENCNATKNNSTETEYDCPLCGMG